MSLVPNIKLPREFIPPLTLSALVKFVIVPIPTLPVSLIIILVDEAAPLVVKNCKLAPLEAVTADVIFALLTEPTLKGPNSIPDV
jgi:hypothetical protein